MPPFGLSRTAVEARLAAVERAWSPRLTTSADGTEIGRRRIELPELGGLVASVEVDQFLDLGPATWLGSGISFVAPTTSRADTAWIRRWTGGLLTTCGLEQVGPDASGDMHGRASSIPAVLERSAGSWSGDEFHLVVEGRMREAALFAQNVSVARTIRARTGVPRIELTDRFRNDGFADARLRMLYHVNIGWPFLADGAAVHVGSAVPRSFPMGPPLADAAETADALVVEPDADGWATAVVESGAGATLTVRWRTAGLPFLTLWRSTAAGGYAVGIEPGTCWPSHVDAPVDGKRGVTIPPHEEHRTQLEITVTPA